MPSLKGMNVQALMSLLGEGGEFENEPPISTT
jgi:hypothetical protein